MYTTPFVGFAYQYYYISYLYVQQSYSLICTEKNVNTMPKSYQKLSIVGPTEN
jgi:hypothetical protein